MPVEWLQLAARGGYEFAELGVLVESFPWMPVLFNDSDVCRWLSLLGHPFEEIRRVGVLNPDGYAVFEEERLVAQPGREGVDTLVPLNNVGAADELLEVVHSLVIYRI